MDDRKEPIEPTGRTTVQPTPCLPTVGFMHDALEAQAGEASSGPALANELEHLRRLHYRSADPTVLDGKSMPVDLEHLDRIPAGRFHAEIDGAHFACFYQPGEHDWLYVVLDTMRDDQTIAEGPLPRFPKWSWSTFLQGHLLSIEDPMYFESNLPVGWFYGTREQDYRESTAKLVTAVARALGIPNERIIFYAISSGGTSGLFTAAKIPGSTAIASNPQFDLTRFLPEPLKQFKEHTGIDLHEVKELSTEPGADAQQSKTAARIDFAATLAGEGARSNYLAIVNCRSSMDYNDQLIPFCRAIGLEPRYGLQRAGNLLLWVIDAHGHKNPHLCFESKTMHFAIDHLAKTLAAGGDTAPLEPLYLLLGELWHEKAGLIAGDADCLADADPLARVRGDMP